MQISATRLCVILSSQFSNSAQLSALSGGGGGGGEGGEAFRKFEKWAVNS